MNLASFVGRFPALGFALLVAASSARAQSPPVLGVQVGESNVTVSVAADPGSPLTIQYTTNIFPDVWVPLTNFTLLTSPTLVTDPDVPDTNRFYRAVIRVSTNMLWVSPGTFVMGSPSNEVQRAASETPHTVTLTRGFYVKKFLVTQAEYLSLMNTNPSYFNTNNGFVQDLQRPVEQVSWANATNYCAALTQQERVAGRIFADWSYRLPTEAEWEYACRAGTATPFYLGNDLLSGAANFNGQFEYIGGFGTSNNASGINLNRTVAVGGYAANGGGLHDMAGNVWEWCSDWFANFTTASAIDPQGPATGTARVFRGGAFNVPGRDCRSAARASTNPALGANTVGFRVVLSGP
jgi:sulfatase modifying factor 1